MIFKERTTILFGNITCDPSIYTMGHPKFIISNQKEESISALRVKCFLFFLFILFQKEENKRTNETLEEKLTELKGLHENNQVSI